MIGEQMGANIWGKDEGKRSSMSGSDLLDDFHHDCPPEKGPYDPQYGQSSS